MLQNEYHHLLVNGVGKAHIDPSYSIWSIFKTVAHVDEYVWWRKLLSESKSIIKKYDIYIYMYIYIYVYTCSEARSKCKQCMHQNVLFVTHTNHNNVETTSGFDTGSLGDSPFFQELIPVAQWLRLLCDVDTSKDLLSWARSCIMWIWSYTILRIEFMLFVSHSIDMITPRTQYTVGICNICCPRFETAASMWVYGNCIIAFLTHRETTKGT